MPRRDLDLMRRQLIDFMGLTPAEVRQIRYWNARQLQDALIDLQVIMETDAEFEIDGEPADESGYDYYAESLDEFDDDFDDDFGEHEYEVIIEGGNTRPAIGR